MTRKTNQKKQISLIQRAKKTTNLSYEDAFAKVKELVFDVLLDNKTISFYWMDANGILLGCNEKVLKDLEIDGLKNYIGKHSNENSTKEAWENSLKAIRSKKTCTYEEEHIDSNSKKITYLSIKHPILDSNGNVLYLLGISLDITDRKKEEMEALLEQIKKTKMAYSSRTDFISKASHEIRSPIGNLISSFDNLEEQFKQFKEIFYSQLTGLLAKNNQSELSEKVKQHINTGIESTRDFKKEAYRALNALINLGDLNRFQTEGISCRFELTNIPDLIRTAITHNAHNDVKQVDIHTHLEPTIPIECIIDYQNVYEALRIIIGNAIRFSPINVIVKINVKNIQENAKNYLLIAVQDFGAGMTETQVANLFQLATLDNDELEQKRYHKPSLQLSLAKLRLEASGGQLELKSIHKQGTTVILKFPYTSENTIPLKTWQKDALASNVIHLLVVEDDQMAQKHAQRYLDELGYQVDVASTGHEAIHLALTNSYDIIFMDITLPDISGIEAMHIIQKSIGEKTPFIAVTSHALETDIDYFIRQGVMAVLTKPVKKQKFKECIRNVLAAKDGD